MLDKEPQGQRGNRRARGNRHGTGTATAWALARGGATVGSRDREAMLCIPG